MTAREVTPSEQGNEASHRRPETNREVERLNERLFEGSWGSMGQERPEGAPATERQTIDSDKPENITSDKMNDKTKLVDEYHEGLKSKIDVSGYPESDQRIMQTLEEALVTGDLGQFTYNLQQHNAAFPGRLPDVINNLDDHIEKTARDFDLGFFRKAALDVSLRENGNVLLSIPGRFSQGVEINPQTGKSTLVEVLNANGQTEISPLDGSPDSRFNQLGDRFSMTLGDRGERPHKSKTVKSGSEASNSFQPTPGVHGLPDLHIIGR